MTGMRTVPFNVQFPRVTAGGSATWIGQGRAIPASSLAFDQITFTFSKIAGIVILTKELATKFSDPSAEALCRLDLQAAVAQFTDDAFLNPTLAAVTDVSPASITNGAVEVVSDRHHRCGRCRRSAIVIPQREYKP